MIKKTTWIIIPVVFWAIPTAVVVACMLSLISSGEEAAGAQQVNGGSLLRNIMIYVPIFVTIGIALGIYFHKLWERYRKP